MSDNKPNENLEAEQNEQIQLYRKRRAEGFKLNISEGESSQADGTRVFTKSSASQGEAVNSSNEITSFSDETTRAQIERDSKKAIKAEKKEADKIKKIKGSRNKKIYRIAWLLLIIILSTVAAQFMITAFNDVFAVNRTDDEIVSIIVAKDDTADDVAKKLEAKGVIDSALIFSLFLDVTGKGDGLEPGVYQVAKNKDYLGVINYLRNTGNRLTTITLQFTEGMTVPQIAQQLYESGVTSDKDKFLSLCNSENFDDDYTFIEAIEENEKRIYKLEGYLFPDTYEFYVDEDPELTISRFLDNFETKITKTKFEVDGYSESMTIEKLSARTGMSIDYIVNIAGLVQGEAADTEDMYNVSSVIHNRLERGAEQNIYTLGMDSSQFYPYSSAQEVPEDIRDTFESDYETYNNQGLPPGAICSPGMDALMAAAAPNRTDYFYFCHGTNSDGSVTPYYAESIYEHQNNLNKAGLS